MDKDIGSEKHSGGEILSLSLSAEVSGFLSSMSTTSLMKYNLTSITNIAGSTANLSQGNINKNVIGNGTLSGDIMLGVADPNRCGDRKPYLLLFRIESNGDYAYDMYSLSSLSIGQQVVQCRHLDAKMRSGRDRYLAANLYTAGREKMPNNQPVDISDICEPIYTSDFKDYLSSAMVTASDKLK